MVLFIYNRCLNLLCQRRYNLIQITNNSIIRHIKNRGCLILVDCNDDIGFLHACQMLNRTRDTDGKIYIRAYRLTCLSNL